MRRTRVPGYAILRRTLARTPQSALRTRAASIDRRRSVHGYSKLALSLVVAFAAGGVNAQTPTAS